jgi:hypothetical protein
MKKYYLIILVITLFSLSYCKKNYGNNLHPIQKAENYNGNINLPIEERLLATPDIIIDILNEFDSVDYYSSKELNGNEKQLFMNYYDLLPLKYKEIIKEKVVGIYFVNNFLGGGMTEAIFDNKGNMLMVLFFNPEILYRNITDWINFRDNTAFINNANKISLTIECNSNYYALIHTLFHEASHIYDFYNFVTPYTEEFLKTDKTIFPTDFIKDIWNDYNKPVDGYDFINRENISFYDLGDRVNNNFAIDIYKALSESPFTSIYCSKTWAEDFAETFTWYYLKEYFDIDYITTLFEDEKIIMAYNPNNNELVTRRYKIFYEIDK